MVQLVLHCSGVTCRKGRFLQTGVFQTPNKTLSSKFGVVILRLCAVIRPSSSVTTLPMRICTMDNAWLDLCKPYYVHTLSPSRYLPSHSPWPLSSIYSKSCLAHCAMQLIVHRCDSNLDQSVRICVQNTPYNSKPHLWHIPHPSAPPQAHHPNRVFLMSL